MRRSAVYSEDCTGFVSGGSFNTELPAALVADGSAMLVEANGAAVVKSEADAVKEPARSSRRTARRFITPPLPLRRTPTPVRLRDIEVFAVEVNGQKFATLKEGIAAAKNGGTVTLLSDLGADQVSAGKDKYINIAEAGAKATIDLAGHTITLRQR